MEAEKDEQLDMMALYAFSDASEAESRASWRGFISFVFGYIAELDAENADQIVSSTIVDAPEKLLPENNLLVHHLHILSAQLAQMFGMSAEFGLACLLDFNPPTRSFAITTEESELSQEDLITMWLVRFQELQQDPGFQSFLAHWKEFLLENNLLDELIEEIDAEETDENADEDREGENTEDERTDEEADEEADEQDESSPAASRKAV